MPAVSTGRVVARGFRGWREWRTILVLYLSTLLPALPLFFGVAGLLRDPVGHAVSTRVEPAAESFFWLDAFKRVGDSGLGASLVIPTLLLSLLFQIILAGGLVQWAGREPRPYFGNFFGACGAHLRHNIACFLIFMVISGVVLGAWVGASFGIAWAAKENLADTLLVKSIIAGVRWGITALLAVIMLTAYDIARGLRRVRPFIGAFRATGDGLLLVLRNPVPPIVLLLFWALVGGLFQFATMAPLDRLTLGGTIALAHAGIILRCMIRVSTWASIGALVEESAAKF